MMGKAGYFHPTVASVHPSPSQEPLGPKHFSRVYTSTY